MDFSLTSAQLELQERTRRFIADKIIPLETDPRATSHGPTEALNLWAWHAKQAY
jgi:acyl-CoA dehydrogenase